MTVNFDTSMSLRPNEVAISALQLFIEHFETRPKLIVKASADEDYPSSYGDDDETGKTKAKLRLKLYDEVEKKVEKILKKNPNISVETYLISFPESSYTDRIRVIYGKRGTGIHEQIRIVFQAQVSEDTDPAFTLLATVENEIFKELEGLLTKIKRPVIPRADMIHLVSVENNDFYLNSIDIKERQHEFTYDNYNEDFKAVSHTVIKALRTNKESGLVLFHGGVGTGKTSYMKFLINQIISKKIIYIPPDMVTHLSSPSFVSFLIRQAKDSILLIEDAETVLQKRKGGQNQSVSNILNISDGILGDILQMQLVCTFNCDISDIDPALLRPGRLIAEYKFDKLSVEKARKLMKTLYKEDIEVKEPMSVAEIYNYKKPAPKTSDDGIKTRKIVIKSVVKTKKDAN